MTPTPERAEQDAWRLMTPAINGGLEYQLRRLLHIAVADPRTSADALLCLADAMRAMAAEARIDDAPNPFDALADILAEIAADRAAPAPPAPEGSPAA